MERFALTLNVRGSEPDSVFRLLGADENSATYALGWALERSPSFRATMTKAWFGHAIGTSPSIIALQRHAQDKGFTDLEFQQGLQYHAILEAKRWWSVPTQTQLRRYGPRLKTYGAQDQRLVTVSSADSAFAGRHLPAHIGGVKIVHLSWGDIHRLAKSAVARASKFEEKLWLRHLVQHLQEFVAVDRLTSNDVYVVSLGASPMVGGRAHTWIDVVEKDGCYFHPIQKGWPTQPPNYIGFRYRGRLQSVHHVEKFEVVRDLSTVNPAWLKTTVDHFVYRLGAPMRPAAEVRTGNIFRNGRVHCAIDTLLSGAFTTISEARDETKRRLTAPL